MIRHNFQGSLKVAHLNYRVYLGIDSAVFKAFDCSWSGSDPEHERARVEALDYSKCVFAALDDASGAQCRT